MVQNTAITISPKGYLFQVSLQSDCFIGISSIPDKYNQYRLGTIFLRNFYTALDYENNMVMFGINKGTTSAKLVGKAENPNKHTSTGGGNGAVWGIVIFLLCMFGVAAFCFVRAKRNERQRLVTFAPTKTLREQDEAESKQTAINDSMDNSKEEYFLGT